MSLPDVKTHDAWTQGVKCSHPEADAADSEKSYLEIKRRWPNWPAMMVSPRNGRVRAGTLKPVDTAKSADADWRCREGSADSSKLGRRPSPYRHPSGSAVSPGHERPRSRRHGRSRKRCVASQGLGIGDLGFFVPLCASYAAKHIGWPQGGRKDISG